MSNQKWCLWRRKMVVELHITHEEIKMEPEKAIHQEMMCPLWLCVLATNNGSHHGTDKFSCWHVQSSELQTYTWLNATLKELTSLVTQELERAHCSLLQLFYATQKTQLSRRLAAPCLGWLHKPVVSEVPNRRSLWRNSHPSNWAPPPSDHMRSYCILFTISWEKRSND